MHAQQLGFASSWKMLTRDKGWIKPLLVLTLVGWIPILGQIAILGYGLEWARLTAWGVDAAPKQRNVMYGKVLSTGGIALLIMVTMGLVLGVIDVLLFGTWYPIAAFPMGIGVFSSTVIDIATQSSFVAVIVLLVVNLFMGTFTTAAMMRATIYDSFGAGWRVDRLFQMIGRDPGGFFHAYAVSLIGGIVNTVYSVVVTLLGGLFAFGGVMSIAIGAGMHGAESVERVILGMGPGIVVVAVIIVVAVMFIGGVISTAMQLLAINAVGQWFCRFEVGRWGVSSAPLPDGVPAGRTGGAAQAGGMPQQPGASSASATSQQQVPVADAVPQQPHAPVAQQPGVNAEPQQPGAYGVAPQVPVDQGFQAESTMGAQRADVSPVADAAGAETVPADTTSVQPTTVLEPEADAPAAEAPGQTDEGAVQEEPAAAGPILLGPVVTDADDQAADAASEDGSDEDGSPIERH